MLQTQGLGTMSWPVEDPTDEGERLTKNNHIATADNLEESFSSGECLQPRHLPSQTRSIRNPARLRSLGRVLQCLSGFPVIMIWATKCPECFRLRNLAMVHRRLMLQVASSSRMGMFAADIACELISILSIAVGVPFVP